MATPEAVAERAEAPPVAGPEAITFRLVPVWHGIFGDPGIGWLNKYTVERKEMNKLMGLCAIAGVDFMALGQPGVGKTYGIELMADYCFVDMSLFTHLLAKDQSANEVLGSQDVAALKEGRIRRITEGMLPEANFGYLDEFFKASPPTVNPLLDIMATRKLKVGGEVIKCDKLISIAMSSNELPTGREDLSAMRDRIDVCFEVENVKTPAGWFEVFKIQREIRRNGIDTSGLTPLSFDDSMEARSEVKAVDISDDLGRVMCELLGEFQKKDHLPSMRRFERMQRMCMAHAWTNKRTEVAADDLWPIMHMAWNDLDHQKGAQDVVTDKLGTFKREATLMKETMDTIMAEVNGVQEQIAKTQTREDKEVTSKKGSDLIKRLRKVREECDEAIERGKALGEDVTPVEEVRAEIDKARQWAVRALSGME